MASQPASSTWLRRRSSDGTPLRVALSAASSQCPDATGVPGRHPSVVAFHEREWLMSTTAHPVRRRLCGAAALLGLASGVTLIGPAGPAQAVPGASTVSVSSAPSSVAKSVTANCPGGSVLYGGSGRIVTGGGKVLITDMVPAANLASVRVNGAENDAYGLNWRVEAT